MQIRFRDASVRHNIAIIILLNYGKTPKCATPAGKGGRNSSSTTNDSRFFGPPPNSMAAKKEKYKEESLSNLSTEKLFRVPDRALFVVGAGEARLRKTMDTSDLRYGFFR